MIPGAWWINENKADVCFMFTLHILFMPLWERFYSSISSNIFSPKYSCLAGPRWILSWIITFLISLFSLSLRLSISYDALFIYFIFPFSALLQIKDVTAPSHSTSVTVMWKSPKLYFSGGEEIFWKIEDFEILQYKFTQVNVEDILDTILVRWGTVTDLL